LGRAANRKPRCEQNLIDQIRDGHSSSIAASMNRRGAWINFSVHHMLGSAYALTLTRVPMI
jgi:hypothetical protein